MCVIWHDAPSRRRTASMPSCWHAGTIMTNCQCRTICSAVHCCRLQTVVVHTGTICAYTYLTTMRVLVARTVTFRPTLHTSEGLTDNPYDPLTHYHQPCSLRTVHYLLPVPVLRSDLDRYVFTHTTNFKPSDTNGGQVEASL